MDVFKYLEYFHMERGEGICDYQDSRTEYMYPVFLKLGRVLGGI